MGNREKGLGSVIADLAVPVTAPAGSVPFALPDGRTGWQKPVTPSITSGFSKIGLAQWIKADVGVVTNPDTSVVSWTDLSGHGRHWGVGAGKVYLVPNVKNGLPMVRASNPGEPNYLSCPAFFFGTQQAEVFVIIRSSQQYNFAWNGMGPNGGFNRGVHFTNASYVYEHWGTTVRVFGAIGSWSAFHRLNISSGSNYSVRVDGVQVASSSGYSRRWNDGMFYLFAGTLLVPGYQWRGEIGEMLIYDHVLSSSDRALVYSYLSTRWGF